MAIGMNPMMMGGMGMMGMGGMGQMFMMMQMMQMMQMMMSMMGSMGGGQQHGCGCGHQGMGQSMGMPGAYPGGMPMMPMPMPMPMPGQYPPMSQGQYAPPISNYGMQAHSPTGAQLQNSIFNCPVPPGCCPGYCYRGVKHHLRNVGVNLSGGSAYQAAGQLANRPDRFKEVSVSRAQLKQLPPGAVVVWNRSPGKPHGHISIATGDGREASDKIRNQITNRPASYRVFIPK
jgi:hypothetical protein